MKMHYSVGGQKNYTINFHVHGSMATTIITMHYNKNPGNARHRS